MLYQTAVQEIPENSGNRYLNMERQYANYIANTKILNRPMSNLVKSNTLLRTRHVWCLFILHIRCLKIDTDLDKV